VPVLPSPKAPTMDHLPLMAGFNACANERL